MCELLGHVGDRSVLGRSLHTAVDVAMNEVVQVLEMNLPGAIDEVVQGRWGVDTDPLYVARSTAT